MRFILIIIVTLVFVLFILLNFIGCKKDALRATEPFYFNIPAVSVYTTPTQGTTSNKITDIWIYENGNFKGVYPIGRTIPLLSNPSKLRFFAGIKNNGIYETAIYYPFYAPIDMDTSANANTIVTKNLKFNYKSGINFFWIEDFENFGGTSGVTIIQGSGSTNNLILLDKTVNPSADVFEGNKCMLITMDNAHPYTYLISAQTYSLSSSACYLEMNYKCNQSFDVGLYTSYTTKSVISLNPTSSWNKIYIELTPFVGSLIGSSVGIYFQAGQVESTPQILIDNIKIISY